MQWKISAVDGVFQALGGILLGFAAFLPFYARKAIETVNNTSFFYLSSKPAKLLSDLYEKPQTLTKGKTLVMEFTPTKTGSY